MPAPLSVKGAAKGIGEGEVPLGRAAICRQEGPSGAKVFRTRSRRTYEEGTKAGNSGLTAKEGHYEETIGCILRERNKEVACGLKELQEP